MRVSLATQTLSALLAISVLAACSAKTSGDDNVNAVNTTSLEAEGETGNLTAADTSRGEKVYVASENLRMHTTAEAKDSNVAGTVLMNDELQILDTTRIGDQQMISVKVISSKNKELEGKQLFASAKYLNAEQVEKLSPSTAAGEESGQDHYVIVNIATEMIRLYRHCHAPESCQNKMLMEFHGTVGNNSDGRRTDVGVYKTTSWTKFYESAPEYAGWYRADYPPLPKPGSRGGWLSKSASPPGFTSTRGAFGWYTVFVGPNNSSQWMHGTIGWGEDKSNFVRFQDSFLGGLVGIFAKLGSHGCTRLSNEAIAFMRSNLPVGAYVFKVYAKETLKDPSLQGFPQKTELGHFPYILTKLGAGQKNTRHDLASRDAVLKAGTPESEWLDQGTFDYDQTPTPASGDHYKVGNFQGVFNVDEGTFSSDYVAPTSDRLHHGGYPGQEKAFPAFVKDSIASSNLTAAAPVVLDHSEDSQDN